MAKIAETINATGCEETSRKAFFLDNLVSLQKISVY